MNKINLQKETIRLLAILFFIFAISIVEAQDVLIIYDDSPTNANTLSLASSLTAAGFNVTFSDVPENLWDNTNPSLTGFEAVIHLNGTTYNDEMPLAGQLALLDFVENNNGYYIGSEWNGYQIDSGEMLAMQDLILLDRGNSFSGTLDYTTVPGLSFHPVLEGISDFQIVDAEVNGSAHIFSSNPSVVLMTEGTRDAVLVREFGIGKVLGFHHCGNWSGLSHFSDVNIQNIIINFINWGSTKQCNVIHSSNNTSNAVNSTPLVFGQSFIAECNGNMEYFELISTETGTISSGTLYIYNGNVVSGTPVYTQAYPEIIITAAGDPITFDITGTVPLIINDQYTFVFTVDNVDFLFEPIGTYTGGNAWQSGASLSSVDMIFSISILNSTLGIDDPKVSNSQILYPNPATDFILISGLTKSINYSVFDILGAEVLNGIISNNKTIDIQNLKSGIYLIKLENGNTIKFSKK